MSFSKDVHVGPRSVQQSPGCRSDEAAAAALRRRGGLRPAHSPGAAVATGQLALCLAGLQQSRARPERPAVHSQTNNGLEFPLAVSHPRHLYNAALLSLGGIENVSLMSHLYTGACSGDLAALATALGWWRGRDTGTAGTDCPYC